MNDVKRFSRLWCLWNLGLIEGDKVLCIMSWENLFSHVLQSEWMKVSSNTDESWKQLEEEAQKILEHHSLRPIIKGENKDE